MNQEIRSFTRLELKVRAVGCLFLALIFFLAFLAYHFCGETPPTGWKIGLGEFIWVCAAALSFLAGLFFTALYRSGGEEEDGQHLQ